MRLCACYFRRQCSFDVRVTLSNLQTALAVSLTHSAAPQTRCDGPNAGSAARASLGRSTAVGAPVLAAEKPQVPLRAAAAPHRSYLVHQQLLQPRVGHLRPDDGTNKAQNNRKSDVNQHEGDRNRLFDLKHAASARTWRTQAVP